MTYDGPVGGLSYGGGFGNGWEGLIGLALVAGLFDGGFNGIGGRNGSNGEIQRGFDTQSILSKLDGINSGLCDGFYAMNTGMLNGFGSVNQSLCQGFSGLNMAVYQNGTETRSAINDLGYRMQDCCCQTQRAIEGVNYNMAKNTCDIIQASNAGTQRIIDYLTAKENSNLRDENLALKFQASQFAQNSYLVNHLRPAPQPSYVVPNPYTGCGYNYGYSNCGCASVQ